MVDVLQVLLNGMATGGLYALLAIGYALVFGTLRFVNFAHGDICMLGAYAVAALTGARAPIMLGASLGAVAAGTVSAALYAGIYRPLMQRHRLWPLMAAVAVSLLLQHGVQTLVSPDALPFPIEATESVVTLLGGRLIFRLVDLGVLLCAVAMALGLWTLTQCTSFGLAMRAIASQPVAAALNGVPVARVMAGTFFVSGALACVSSTLQGILAGQIHPMMGVAAGLKAFVAAVLGGIDSIWGALLGGILLGIAESALIECGASSFKEAVLFVLLIGTLLVRPRGLLGSSAITKV